MKAIENEKAYRAKKKKKRFGGKTWRKIFKVNKEKMVKFDF